MRVNPFLPFPGEGIAQALKYSVLYLIEKSEIEHPKSEISGGL